MQKYSEKNGKFIIAYKDDDDTIFLSQVYKKNRSDKFCYEKLTNSVVFSHSPSSGHSMAQIAFKIDNVPYFFTAECIYNQQYKPVASNNDIIEVNGDGFFYHLSDDIKVIIDYAEVLEQKDS